jgi:hypothetical protein
MDYLDHTSASLTPGAGVRISIAYGTNCQAHQTDNFVVFYFGLNGSIISGDDDYLCSCHAMWKDRGLGCRVGDGAADALEPMSEAL